MIGVVLAGGASSRFGGRPKGLMKFAGRPMALHIADMLAGFCSSVVIEGAPDAGYETLGLGVIHSPVEHSGKGPLAGLAVGLAVGGGPVAFAPCDMPVLRPAIYLELAGSLGSAPGAYSRTVLGVEPLVAILSVALRPVLLAALAGDVLPRTHAVLDAAGAACVAFADARPFANVNTPSDLEQLERLG